MSFNRTTKIIEMNSKMIYFFKTILPPIYPIGIYAPTKSTMLNQVGEGSINTLVIPPNKNKPPIPSANFILWLLAIFATTIDPTNVPRA